MKVVVCVKEVVADRQPQFVFQKTGQDIDPSYAAFETNEADLYAIEEGLRLCEKPGGGEVIVVTFGDARTVAMLQKCVAMGATRAVRVWSPAVSAQDPLLVARALAVAVKAENPDVVLCGVQSSDAAQQSTGPALAAALGLPCVAAVAKVDIENGQAAVHRELDGGLVEVVEVSLPVLLTVQTGLNVPRSGSFKQLMLAKKTPIAVVDPGTPKSRSTIKRMFLAPVSGERAAMIPGSPSEIASRIIELVQGDVP